MTSLAFNSPLYDNLLTDWIGPEDCVVNSYIVSYQLTNQDQCLPIEGDLTQETTTDTSILLQRLEAYSTYEVSVSAINDGGEGEIETGSGITSESGRHIDKIVIQNKVDTLVESLSKK